MKGWRRKAAISEGQASESVHPRGSFTEDIRSRGFCALHMNALTSFMWRTLVIPCPQKQFAAGSPSPRGGAKCVRDIHNGSEGGQSSDSLE
jgi:hypothetical protein